MEKTKVLIIAVIALFLLNAGTLAFLFLNRPHPPEFRHDGPPMGPPRPDRLIIESLGLDSNQQKQFELLKSEHHSNMVRLDEASKDLHHRYYDLLRSDHPNLALADSLAVAMGLNRKAIEQLNFDHFQKIRALCTDRQKSSFDSLVSKIADIFSRPPMPPPPPGAGRPPLPRENRQGGFPGDPPPPPGS